LRSWIGMMAPRGAKLADSRLAKRTSGVERR
jgi:hypothetical protein